MRIDAETRRARIRRIRVGAGIGALLLILAGCASDPGARSEPGAKKPKTTQDGAALGYAEAIPRDLEELPKATDVAVAGTVTRIESALLNTETGEWSPSPSMSAEELHNLFSELVPITEIHLSVDALLGERQESALEIAPGTEVVVRLLGGTATVTLTPEEAKAIGITVPIKEGEGEPNQDPDNLTYPTETAGLTVSMEPGAFLVEGDTLVAFLTADTMDLYPGPVPAPVVVAVDTGGVGFFRLKETGIYENAVSRSPVDEAVLREVAESVSDEAGKASNPPGTY